MIEVFKTDVKDAHLAGQLIDQIHQTFSDYEANFDLEDCDHILRVKSNVPVIQSYYLIMFLRNLGCRAEVLEAYTFNIEDHLNGQVVPPCPLC